MDRRTLLSRTAPLVAAGLAGCLGDDGDGGPDTPTAEPTGPTPTDESTPDPTESPTATDSPTEEPTDSPTPTATPAADPDQTIVVGPGGSLRFDPERFEVAVGDTVQWAWDSPGHNVSPTAAPDGSDWEGKDEEFGYPGDATHSHTFETAGDYEYVCQPHQSSGMVGSFAVTE